jgi:hypothetical protein
MWQRVPNRADATAVACRQPRMLQRVPNRADATAVACRQPRMLQRVPNRADATAVACRQPRMLQRVPHRADATAVACRQPPTHFQLPITTPPCTHQSQFVTPQRMSPPQGVSGGVVNGITLLEGELLSVCVHQSSTESFSMAATRFN